MKTELITKQLELRSFKNELIDTLAKKNLITRQYELFVESGMLDEKISFLNLMIEHLEEQLTE